MDELIRRQRTLREAEMLMRSKKRAGVAAPFLYNVDPPAATLVMEHVRGKRVKDILESRGGGKMREVFKKMGADVARLHSSAIMHGDLTTANVVLRGSELVFLDFGLSLTSSRVEDHAVDLRLIKETLVGAHPTASRTAFEALREGYTAQAGLARSRAVFSQLAGIERRGRYARVD